MRTPFSPAKDERLKVWECTPHVTKGRETRGAEAAADLLARLGSWADPARDLACRLYTTSERTGWAEEARASNGLVVAWSEVEKLAGKSKAQTMPTKDGVLL
jgi:putative DNA methylase